MPIIARFDAESSATAAAAASMVQRAALFGLDVPGRRCDLNPAHQPGHHLSRMADGTRPTSRSAWEGPVALLHDDRLHREMRDQSVRG